MVKPVATRLRSLLKQDPTRSRWSLLMTGHSGSDRRPFLLPARNRVEAEQTGISSTHSLRSL